MAATAKLDRVRFLTGTTGTGAITAGSAFSNRYLTPAEASLSDGAEVHLLIEEGTDFELSRCTYTVSSTSFSRDTVLRSKIGGVAGSSKMNLGGSAIVSIVPVGSELVASEIANDSSVDGDTLNAALEALNAKINDPWWFHPVGVPIPVMNNITGVDLPPTDQDYRYVLLTAGETGGGEYNNGVLTSESVSGSAPLVLATAVIDDSESPMDGQTIQLINTARRFLRAAVTAGTVENDALQNITGQLSTRPTNGGGNILIIAGGAFAQDGTGSNTTGLTYSGTQPRYDYSFDASRVARTDDETRVKNLGVPYVVRIK